MESKETRQKLKERIALGLTYGLKAVEEVISVDAAIYDELINFKSPPFRHGGDSGAPLPEPYIWKMY